MAPLRILTYQKTTFHLVKGEQFAFSELKDKITKDVMAYFYPTKKTKLLGDARPVRLGAVLTQEGTVISYGSKALTDVETR